MRHIILTTFATVLGVATIVVGAVYVLDRPTILRVAVPRKSEDSKLLTAFQQTLQEDGKNIRFNLVPVEDFSASAAALVKGDADIAVVRTDIAMSPKSQTLVILYREAAVLMTPHTSKITSINALKGQKIGVIKGRVSAPGNSALLKTVMGQYNIQPANFTIVELAPEDVPKALQKHEVDAIFAVGVPQSAFMADTVKMFAGNEGPPNFIPVSEADLIADRAPSVESLTVSAGTFGGSPHRPAEDFDTLSVSVRLMTMNTMSDAVAANILRYMFAERPQIAVGLPLANRLEAPATDKGQALPVHTGAAAFLDSNEQTFLDRYSDFIYLGAMFFSALGSGLAAFTTRAGLKMCKHIDAHLEQLLQLMKAAREAKDGAALDRIERETDAIVASALGRDKVSGLQGHRASAFSLALEHLRSAIADRRRALGIRSPMLAIEHKPGLVPATGDLELS